ncbi:MAG: histidine kinase dimerization/phospho-acceptor domain-containing protein, partial [Anaerolineaceae bacterium]
KCGPSEGLEVTTTWSSGQNLASWLNETNLYDEPGFWDLMHPTRPVVITTASSRVSRPVRDLLNEAQVQTLVIFPLTATGDWLGCLLVFFSREHHFHHVDLAHLKVLVDLATITLYNLRLLEIEEETRHEAERANEIKTEFLAMISHELRTPLTSIFGFTSTLLAGDVTWDPEEQRDFIQTIQRESSRLQELIDHLLDLSRLEAGMLPITQRTRQIHEVIRDALPQLQTLTARHRLRLAIPTELPPVNVDAIRAVQVLVNLVRNASTYSPEDTEIGVTARLSGQFVQINVSDQGPGIPVSEQKRVFEAFRRGGSVDEASAPKGAGLGLAICKRLIEAH